MAAPVPWAMGPHGAACDVRRGHVGSCGAGEGLNPSSLRAPSPAISPAYWAGLLAHRGHALPGKTMLGVSQKHCGASLRHLETGAVPHLRRSSAA
jgi:hypothetical protein